MDNDKSYVPEGRPYKYCSNCGAKIDLNAEICPACGVAQAVVKTKQNNSGVLDLGSHKNPEVDRDGLSKLKFGALLGIIGLVLTMIPGYFMFGIFTAVEAASNSSVASTSASRFAGISTATVAIVAVAMVAGVILFLISIIEYRRAFGILKESNPSLASPHSLMKWLFVGLILSVILIPVSMVIILGIVASASSSSASTGIGGVFASFSIIFIIIIIAGIMSFIGYIGMIIGLYRSGEIFDEGIMRVGAILYIIPYLNIIAPILIYMGAVSAGKDMKD